MKKVMIFRPLISLGGTEIAMLNLVKYLKGYEIEANNPNGICALTYLGVSLGGGKAVNGRIKNYYPKGLRNV